MKEIKITRIKKNMKKKNTRFPALKLAVVAMLTILNAQLSTLHAQGTTAFTYQGRLFDGTNPANGSYDFMFTANDALTNGSVVGGPVTNAAVIVTNGLFTTPVDFGQGTFNGNARYLGIYIKIHTNTGGHLALSPLQPITPAPYSLYAPNAGTANLAVNVSATGPVVAPSLNVGQSNILGAVNSTIAGGAYNVASGNYDSIAGGYGNVASSNSATIGGGSYNLAIGNGALVSGGMSNIVQGNISIGPCGLFFLTPDYSWIAGGTGNANSGWCSGMGGYYNQINNGAYYAIIAGGEYNTIQCEANESVISGGTRNTIQTGASDSTIGGGL